MTRIFVTRHLPSPALELLRALPGVIVDVSPHDRILTKAELIQGSIGADILVCMLTDCIDASALDAAGPQLKMIANYAVGFDNIDLQEARKRHIVVTNSPSPYVAESVAEHALALTLAVARRVVEHDRATREGTYSGWGPEQNLGMSIVGKTVGIVGGGAIGDAFAHMLKYGMNMHVQYCDIKTNEHLESTCKATCVSQDELLRTSDAISLHVPLLPSTRHLIDAPEFALMKPGAILINTARGAVVNSSALIDALESGRIAGAGLDVFEGEPNLAVDSNVAARLRACPNVVFTPHTGSATVTARAGMSRTLARNIEQFLRGESPENAVH